jgi:DDE superfamily endonuclease
MVAAEVDPGRLVFVDEMGLHTSLAPLYGYSPKGERVRLEVPRNRGKNTTLLASMTLLGGMGETMAVEGSTDREVFETYVWRVLAPTLDSGQVVIMDNLPAHKPARVRELIEERDCELVYLPSYSPDFNPIDICQPQCAFKHKLSYHWPRRAARTTGVGREARSRPPTQRRGGSAMSSRGAVPPRP